MLQPQNPTQDDQSIFAEVALPLHVTRNFTYRLPPSLSLGAEPGSRVIVPLGKNKHVTGYIVELHSALEPEITPEGGEIKNVIELIDSESLLSPEVIDLARWIADYYVAPLGEVLRAALPAGLNAAIDEIVSITSRGRDEERHLKNRGSETTRARILATLVENSVSMKQISTIVRGSNIRSLVRSLSENGLVDIVHSARTDFVKPKRRKMVRVLASDGSDSNGARPLSPAQSGALKILENNMGEMLFTELVDKIEGSASTIQTLSRRGLVEVFVSDVRRDPLASAVLPPEVALELTDEQRSAFDEITESLETGEFRTFLLHGVTGSGKTEVYIRAMRTALANGKSSMMLVPEIALTPVFSRRLRSHFGTQVAILHSSLSTGERFDEWNRVRRGEASIVIGTRSAVFAPVRNLGLIIIDEEHDASYRQQESPYYSGRDAAIIRASRESATIVLGSATPSMESYYNAKKGKYKYLSLPFRVLNRAMAKAEMIDMRDIPAKAGRPEPFSQTLLDAIAETHQRGDQSIILLNRRGYSSFVMCRSCGKSVQCVNCDVTLTWHREESALICHYCNYRQRTPSKCPSCEGSYIYFIGEGTEQIEDILQHKFPQLRIARVDRDTVQRRRSFEETLQRFSAGELDMLVGTQMLAKGHDYPNVTLVGVVSVDAGLALPDFRSAERTFQLITQVAGRAGRGERPGKVLIQTWYPEHYALRYACAQDFEGFYEEELRHRRNMNFPPFVSLAALLIQDENFETASRRALELRSLLDSVNSERRCRILGPAPAPLSRLRGKHRIQLLLKSGNRQYLRQTIDAGIQQALGKGLPIHSVNIEIDPVNLM